jgi:hypothetical protein
MEEMIIIENGEDQFQYIIYFLKSVKSHT